MDNEEKGSRGLFGHFVDLLISIGLGESMIRVGTTILSVVMLGSAVWLLRVFYAQTPNIRGTTEAVATEPAIAVEGIASVPQNVNMFNGIPRVAQPYTII